MVVVAIAGVLVAAAIPSMTAWRTRLEARSSARSVADLLLTARSDAIRTSTQQIVYLRIQGVGITDPNGTGLLDAAGNNVDALLLQDDDGDCNIDAGEPQSFLNLIGGISFGLTNTTLKAPSDGASPLSTPTTATGATFINPASPASAVRWILFRPDGIPVAFEGGLVACGAIGTTGSGNGAVYMTDGTSDFAAVLSPLGSTRLHAFDRANNGWTF